MRASEIILGDEELAAIGAVAVESTFCEINVEKIIWALCSVTEEQGKFLTHAMQLEKRLELMGDLWKPVLDDAKRAILTKLISDLKEANNDRNTVIHGQWMFRMRGVPGADNSPEGILTGKGWSPPETFAAKRRLKLEPLEFQATKLNDLAEKISVLTSNLLEFAKSEKLEIDERHLRIYQQSPLKSP